MTSTQKTDTGIANLAKSITQGNAGHSNPEIRFPGTHHLPPHVAQQQFSTS